MADIDLSQFENESGAATEALRRLRQAASDGSITWDDFNDNMIDWGGNVRRSSDTLKKLGDSVTNASTALGKGFGALGKSARKMSDGNITASGFVDNLGGSMEKLADGIPVVGGMLGGLAAAGTGLLAGLFAFSEGLVQTNKDLKNAGFAFTGMDAIADAASDANMSIGTFSKVILDNVDTLRLMAGGTPGGIKALSAGFKVLTKESGNLMQQYYSMGYTQEDVADAMILTATQLSRAGMSNVEINEKLITSTDRYLRTQRELNTITGVSVKDAKRQAEENMKKFAIQAELDRIQAENGIEARKGMEIYLAGLKDSDRQMAALGKSTSTTAYLFAGMNTEANIIADIGKRLRENTLSYSDAPRAFAQALVDNADQIRDDATRAKQTFSVDMSLMSGGALAMAEYLQTAAISSEDQLKGAEAYLNGMHSNVTALDKSLITIEDFQNTLSYTVSGIGLVMTQMSGKPLTGLLESMKNGASIIDDVTQAFGKYMEAVDKKDAAGQAAALADLKSKVSGMFEASKDALVSGAAAIMQPLSKIIADGIADGFDDVLAGLGFSSSEDRVNAALKAVTESQLNNGSITESSVFDALSDLRDRDLEKLNQLLSDKKINISREQTEIGSRWGGTYMRDGFKATKNAYGNIIEPKVGGSLNIVGEAGRHEAIIPLTRTGGDLGIKMTGKLIDESKTMPAILEQIKNNTNLTHSMIELLKNIQKEMERNNSLVKQGNMMLN